MDRRDFLKHFMDVDRPLRSYFMGVTGNVHETDDLVQAAYVVLWEKLDEFDDSRSFRAWAIGIARLEALKWRQRKARSREVLLSEEAMSRLAETAVGVAEEINVRHAFLLDCIEKLQGFQRRVLHMKYANRLLIREIAGQLGRNVPAIEMVLVRARRSLRECIETRMAEAG